jgi:phosphoribosyl-ATP pyrophosphohydrolase/phosphoribosyl-AMP cyclohydrolase
MTDRTLEDVTDLDRLDFDKLGGLVPVLAQDADDGRVLMVAFANREALEKSLTTGQLHFWSRSRAELWKKGETSGNVLDVVSLHADCDGDSVLARVHPAGPTCHTGEATCFGEVAVPAGVLASLDATLAARQTERPEGSYTVRLLDDRNLRLKKLGEETAELVAALATEDAMRATEEAADLLYHVLVGLRAVGVGAADLLRVLEARAR